MAQSTKNITLIILDGWGINPIKEGNTIANAKTPNMDELQKFYPSCALQASGIAVGLPWGEIGNSEVGHLNMGAGLIVYQNLPKITLSIKEGSFFQNKAFLDAIEHAKKNNSKLHLMGLVSSGGVHSHIEHLLALLELASQHNLKDVYIHMFTDGRDTNPKSALVYLKELEQKIKEVKIGKIVTVCGRHYAMDRNENWKRTKVAYDAMTYGQGIEVLSAEEAIQNSYKQNITDQYIKPHVITKNKEGLIQDNDSVIFFNFRADRARQITKAFILPSFTKFNREKRLKNILFVTMTEYDAPLPVEVAFSSQKIKNPLAKVISNAGLKQLHIAETEKYAHVTYFFNGGIEKPFRNEDNILIPSPSISTYDLIPEMSAMDITERVIKEIIKTKYSFILINYANTDMVAHTGNFDSTIRAVEIIDDCVGKVINAMNSINGITIVTSDHGNAEQKIDYKTGGALADHTTNSVPFILVDEKLKKERDRAWILRSQLAPVGVLADVAPTVLELMNIKKPKEMTGMSLLKNLV